MEYYFQLVFSVLRPTEGWAQEEHQASPGRFERPTLCLEGKCSIHLSYGDKYLKTSSITYKILRPFGVQDQFALLAYETRWVS